MTRANTYTDVEQHEIEAVLDRAGEWDEVRPRNTNERVYDLATAHDDLTVRVFSTLDHRHDDAARDCGRDAIRTVLWSHTTDEPVDGRPHTKRITTWRKNLRRKIEELFQAADDRAAADAAAREEAGAVARELPTAEGDDDEIVAEGTTDTQYGTKALLASPYEAKEDIKRLDWEATHRAWDGDEGCWAVDADALAEVRDHLADRGWTLVRPSEDTDALDVATALDGLGQGDRVTVRYYGKNNGNELSKAGAVERVADERMTFRRDDGQRMYVQPDDRDGSPALFTANSHAPYVGEVYAVEADD
jgi:hypothetical protein